MDDATLGFLIVMTPIFAAILAIVPATIAAKKGLSFWGWWFFGLLLWIIAMPCAILEDPKKRCPLCAEGVRPEALVCPHCGRDIPQAAPSQEIVGTNQKGSTSMRLLPKDEWKIEPLGETHIAAGTHENFGHYYWTKIALADLPNDLISIDDLKRFGIDLTNVAATI